MRALGILILFFLLPLASAYDSSSDFHGAEVAASIYGASCSGSGFSADCYSKPGDRIRIIFSVKNAETVVKDVCLVVKPTRVALDSYSGLTPDSARKIYCMGPECDVYAIDKCISTLPGGSARTSRIEFQAPQAMGDYGFETVFYIKTERGRDYFTSTQSFHSVECLNESDCSNKIKCVGHICGGTTTTTTTTTLAPIKYDYDSNKTIREKAESASEVIQILFFRLPMPVQMFIGFIMIAIVILILNKIIG